MTRTRREILGGLKAGARLNDEEREAIELLESLVPAAVLDAESTTPRRSHPWDGHSLLVCVCQEAP